ncbi:hypothetical protein M430DRAFT_36504 [Amorphotheca resinae ATCC 22711]|uniref:Pentacotripeptide-repeat region of PRORP domain-containing protein n=1 Tax=Amorphotheca resinae ATCC 22711 TaxID=857342 RepID=A0A2T3AUM0_AMORE|nr:hypothetical protein M430DRAFT_36504 [Amorphotheca resinae ATCC 22711]PSS12348.1 hypothetical protein M430DRAFT_36504 [Amorphotheca resinae ATCC 22711]
MPNTPVPSKGALRTLRNLALGTSCTVAFSAGLITEDRRRRIHAAREIHNNAKRLKSSRQYHSSGTAAAFDEQIMKSRDEGFWETTGRSPSRARSESSNTGSSKAQKPIIPAGQEHATSQPSSRSELHSPEQPPAQWKPRPITTHSRGRLLKRELFTPKPSRASFELASMTTRKESDEMPRAENRQEKLASDIMTLLESEPDLANVDAAASRFFEAFEEGILVDNSGIDAQLMDAAVQLSKACMAQKKLEAVEKILDIVLSYGKIEQEVFLAFNPAAIIKKLIEGPFDKASGHTRIDEGRLKKACALYLTKFVENPKVIKSNMGPIGERLCAETCRYGMFDLTEALYWWTTKCNGEMSVRSVDRLITAAHGRGDHKRVLKYFRRFYIQKSPNQVDFYKLVGLVIESSFVSDTDSVSEEILFAAARMAEREGLATSTTWFLKILGHDWRSHQEIDRTRALFERLEPFLDRTRHPQAVYGAIIQFCVEANNEPAALSYYEKLQEFHDPTPADVRIYGHFALAKAMRNDWSGVKEDFHMMKQMGSDRNDYGAAFTPIFNLFAKSHPVKETEEFLRDFVEQYGVVLTPSLSNIVIHEYIKARELDSVSRWLDYMACVNCKVDPMFFNMILKECYKQWKLSFEELHQLYRSVASLGPRTRRFINNDTLSTLRHIAITDSGNKVAETVKRLEYLKLHVPIKRTNCGRDILDSMTVALAKGQAAKVLKIYRQALNEQIPLSASTVTVAVNASLELHPRNIDATACLLRDSQQNGQDLRHALSSMFIRQLSELGNNVTTTSNLIKDTAESTISAMESRGVIVPPHVITHTMSALVRQQQQRQAIDFWESMSHRAGHPPIPIDLATLTTLLQAYIGLKDPTGIEWAIQMLSVNDLIPDRRFRKALINARKEAKKQNTPKFFDSLHRALEVVTEMRAKVGREKENAKIKAVQIMEKAIDVETSRGRRMEIKRVESSDLNPSAFSTEAWAVSDPKSVHSLDVPPPSIARVTVR